MAGQKTMFFLRNKRRLVKKSEDLNKYGPFFIIFPLPVMLKFTVHITAVHLFTCVAKAVTSRRSREYSPLFTVYCFCREMRSPGGSCFPLCNLLKNSVTSGVILKVNMSLFGCKLFSICVSRSQKC